MAVLYLITKKSHPAVLANGDVDVEDTYAIFDSYENANLWSQNVVNPDNYLVRMIDIPNPIIGGQIYIMYFKDMWAINPLITGVYTTLEEARAVLQSYIGVIRRNFANRVMMEPTLTQINARYCISRYALNQTGAVPTTFDGLSVLTLGQST